MLNKEVIKDWKFRMPSSSHLSPLTSEVIGAPQMTLQQYLSTLPCRPLPSGNFQTPFPSIPWCYLPISSSMFLSFLLLSLSPAELSLPCPRILRWGNTICVSFSLPWLVHHALQLHSGFWNAKLGTIVSEEVTSVTHSGYWFFPSNAY